jgi:hypothetical protein
MNALDPDQMSIPFVLDNAEGHGTRAAIEEYTRWLRNKHNIFIKFQLARSPEVNALDLGIWMSLQAVVKCRHRNRRHDIDDQLIEFNRYSDKYLLCIS